MGKPYDCDTQVLCWAPQNGVCPSSIQVLSKWLALLHTTSIMRMASLQYGFPSLWLPFGVHLVRKLMVQW